MRDPNGILESAIDDIDEELGDHFAKANPQLIAAYMHAAAHRELSTVLLNLTTALEAVAAISPDGDEADDDEAASEDCDDALTLAAEETVQ
jgi:hypothetical protein